MRGTSIIVTLFMFQAQASLFDDFTGAMSSVENAISKLLNDVAADVENTIHCTILAMEQVLTVSGAISEPSPDGYKCNDLTESTKVKYKFPSDNFKIDTNNGNRNNHLKTNISHQIKSSISKVNDSLIHIINNGGNKSLKHIKNNYTKRLNEVGLLLRQELDKISKRVNKKYQYLDSGKLSLKSLWHDLETLHSVEREDKNVSEVSEIGEILNEAVNVLHINKTSDIKSDDDKIEVIIHELEEETTENNENIKFSSIDDELSRWKKDRSKLLNYSDQKPEKTSDGIKDLSSNIYNDKDKSRKEIEDYMNKPATETEESIFSHITETKENAGVGGMDSNSHNANTDDSSYYSLFDRISKDDHIKAIDQANDIIKEHSRTETMLGILTAKNGGNSATDVFNSEGHVDFGSF